jgi:phage recombination protein Bet
MTHQNQNRVRLMENFLSDEEIALLKRGMLSTYLIDEQDIFVRLCQRTRLDPFTKQIHATKRFQKVKQPDGQFKKVPTLVPVTGIMGLLAVADRTGQYNGMVVQWCGPDGVWKDEWLEPDPPAAAKCIVYRKDRTYPEVGIARWQSYVGQTYDYDSKTWYVSDFWSKMPDYMLGKCARAQALRGAFPDQLSNLYIREELESDISDTETETEEISPDELKVIETQRRDSEARARGEEFVQATAPPPPAAEMVEPAFTEDKIPPKSRSPQQQVATQPARASSASASAAESKAPAAAARGKEENDELPFLEEEPAPATPWKEYVILTVPGLEGKKIGELPPQYIAAVENQWIPKVRTEWGKANKKQKEDYNAFEAAIAYLKTERPW